MKKVLVGALLVWSIVLSTAVASRWEGVPCGSSFSYDEYAEDLAAEALADGGVTINWLSDTTFTATDRCGCTITITGLPPKKDEDAGDKPGSSSRSTATHAFRSNVIRPARPKSKTAEVEAAQTSGKGFSSMEIPRVGGMTYAQADAFYSTWDTDEGDGETVGLNPSVTFGQGKELTLALALHSVSRSGGDDLVAAGLDASWRVPLSGRWEDYAAGLHAYGLGYFGGDEPESAFGGGPFLSYSRDLTEKWTVSGGGLLEITKRSDSDAVYEVVPGVNVGYYIQPDLVLNTYLIYFQNLKFHVDDAASTDVGLDIEWAIGTWLVSGGIKFSQGGDNTATEVHAGSNWRF